MRMVSTTGAKSTREGATGEREVMAILREHGYNVERGGSLSFGEVPDLTGLPGVHIECKRRETTEIWKWMAQAEADAQRFQDGAPAVFFRRSHSSWMVCMKLSDWLGLYDRQKDAETAERKG